MGVPAWRWATCPVLPVLPVTQLWAFLSVCVVENNCGYHLFESDSEEEEEEVAEKKEEEKPAKKSAFQVRVRTQQDGHASDV